MIAFEDVAWAAGFLEGEGCFALEKGSRKHTFGIRVSACQRRRAPLEKLREVLGGEITVRDKDGRPMYVWRLGGVRAADAIRPLIPYLYGKKEEAQAVVDYAETVDATRGCRPLEDNVIVLRKKILERHTAGRRMAS